jgi:hypothetical protein
MDKTSSLPYLRPPKSKSQSLNQSFEASEDSTKSVSVAVPQSQVLTRLRQHYKRSAKVSPTLAAEVIKDFLLPMFHLDARARTDSKRVSVIAQKRSRNRSFDLKEDSLEPIPGTILGELKLSSVLHEELQQLKAENVVVHSKMKDSEQARISMLSDLDVERKARLQLDGDCKLLRFQLVTAERLTQQTEERLAFVTSQLEQYKELHGRSEAERKRLSNVLHEERWRNDKLKNKSVELENGYSLLRMENEIVGEKLKGMHLAIQSICSRHFLEEKLQGEVQVVAVSSSHLSNYTAEILSDLRSAQLEKDKLREDLIEQTSYMNEIRADRDKIGNSAKERILSLKSELDQAREDREKYKAEGSKMEKKYKDLGDEHDKLRQKLKHIRLKRKQYGEGEEKLCRKCQKTFMDSENFNWSCRTHKAEFSGEMWWCCGRGKDAPGCQVSKHQSKDEDEDNEPRDQEEDERKLMSSLRCPVTVT